MTQLLEKASTEKDFERESLRAERRTSEPVPEVPLEQQEVLEMVKEAVNQLTDKLEAQVDRVTEETIAGIIETVGTNHKKSFAWRAVRRATREILTNTLENDGACEALETAIILVATSGPMVQTIVNTVVK